MGISYCNGILLHLYILIGTNHYTYRDVCVCVCVHVCMCLCVGGLRRVTYCGGSVPPFENKFF